MLSTRQNNFQKFLIGGLLLIGVTIIVTGLVSSPSFVSEHLSSDGVLAKSIKNDNKHLHSNQ